MFVLLWYCSYLAEVYSAQRLWRRASDERFYSGLYAYIYFSSLRMSIEQHTLNFILFFCFILLLLEDSFFFLGHCESNVSAHTEQVKFVCVCLCACVHMRVRGTNKLCERN